MSSLQDKTSAHIPAITGDIAYEDPFLRLPAALTGYKSGILSYTASLVSTSVGFPLDSMKTRMQTHHFANAFACLRATVHHEGVRGLFRGIAAPLISTAFARSLGVSIYTEAKPIVSFLGAPIWGSHPLIHRTAPVSDQQAQIDKVVNNIPIAVLAGSISGAAVSVFACPFELSKIFQQILLLVNNSKENGKGLYSGYRYHLTKDGVSSGLFYGLYETVKLFIQTRNGHVTQNSELQKTINVLSVPISGAVAGCFSWVLVFPVDTIKSQYQRDVIRNILREVAGRDKLPVVAPKLRWPTRELYRGLGPSITRSIVTTMIFFSIFEYLMKNIA
ncbi:hypothetical protein KL921_004645 [Ogataea angusta]|uniref:Uncharacterized protein n=1 Tax=Pichia angusta TaxID=870730 RepID=A0AAN6I363_PICAN|nr:uncharacterized protein KL928_005034 [Ogataea angusta]KAG7806851.1 hypothetical protein KL921_004645 [Ogataea angusta]KAG7816068.1 hypothetical protein KL928_005034 [Ogataea angusta]KAG7835774.1 hypothetical protein KL942_004944 [Ogataea angusta]KAG7842832.1 hypothetical protein KL941_004862 [Ogataea angusta]KAG7845969.1 hypothetical protein KL940_004808 [Ogataea angusta]